MDDAIFKAYDIRGLYPQQIDEPAAVAIGRAVARFLDGSPVVVGWDMRDSGVALRRGLLAGLGAEGVDVIEAGRIATPQLYFAATESGAAGGVMITASHNPGGYNGFKIAGRNAVPIGAATGLDRIAADARALLDEPLPGGRGAVTGEDFSARYFDSLLELFPVSRRRKVVVDAGNGIAGEALEPLFTRLPLELRRLYFEPDGTFPNHEADPLKPENVVDLQREVLDSGAELGVAFDGDGDRCFFIDEHGERVPADLLTALLARTVLEDGLLGARAGARIVYDVRSSRVVPETIRASGGEPVRARVGHSFMKQCMREADAPFGGELSAHFYFRFPSGYVADDGAAMLLLVLHVLEQHDRPLSELWRPLQRYRQSGEVNSRVEDVDRTIQAVRSAFPEGAADELDGLTVSFPDWWFNLRPSNTEPLLRLNVEAATSEDVASHRDRILSVIRAA